MHRRSQRSKSSTSATSSHSPPRDRLRLVEMIVHELSEKSAPVETEQTLNLLDLEGLGAEIWKGIDAQEYVNELQKEWEHRP